LKLFTQVREEERERHMLAYSSINLGMVLKVLDDFCEDVELLLYWPLPTSYVPTCK
jgi:hypothetical protein